MRTSVFIVRPFHKEATRKGQSKGRLRVLCIVVLEREQRSSALSPVLTEGAAVEKMHFLHIKYHEIPPNYI